MYLNARTYQIIYRRQKTQMAINQTNQNTLETETLKTNLTESDNAALRTHLAPKQSKQASEKILYRVFMTISLLFLLCHSPRFILDVHEALYAKDRIACMNAGYDGFPLWALQLNKIRIVLLAINSSFNSAIYCLFSSKFREEAKKCFRCFTT